MKYKDGWQALAAALENVMRVEVRRRYGGIFPRHARIIGRAAAALAAEARDGRLDARTFDPSDYCWLKLPGYRAPSIRRLRYLFGQVRQEPLEDGPESPEEAQEWADKEADDGTGDALKGPAFLHTRGGRGEGPGGGDGGAAELQPRPAAGEAGGPAADGDHPPGAAPLGGGA